MSLFLFSAENREDEKFLDVLVNISKIQTIKCIRIKEEFIILIDYTHEDSITARFNTEESARRSLKDLIKAMNGDVNLADVIRFKNKSDSSSSSEALKDLLKELLK